MTEVDPLLLIGRLADRRRGGDPAGSGIPADQSAQLGSCRDSGFVDAHQLLGGGGGGGGGGGCHCSGLVFTAAFDYRPGPGVAEQVALRAEEKVQLVAAESCCRRPDWLRVRRLLDGGEGYASAAFLVCDLDGQPALLRRCGCVAAAKSAGGRAWL